MSRPRDVTVPIEQGIGTVVVKRAANLPSPYNIGEARWIGIALLEAAALSTRTRSTVKVGIAGKLPPDWFVMDCDRLGWSWGMKNPTWVVTARPSIENDLVEDTTLTFVAPSAEQAAFLAAQVLAKAPITKDVPAWVLVSISQRTEA